MAELDALLEFYFRPTLREIVKDIVAQTNRAELIAFIEALLQEADEEKTDRAVAKVLSLGEITTLPMVDEQICLICALQRTK